MSPEVRSTVGLSRVRNIALLVGIACCVACYPIGQSHPDIFYPAYLVAFLFWIGLSLGSLAISMLHHVTGGGWGIPIRRIVESSAAAILLMGCFILPITHEMGHLYSWSDTAVVSADEILQRKSHYLNKDSFFLRAGVYFAVWILLTAVLNWATASDAVRQRNRQRGLSAISGFGLILWGLSVTFAAVDWGMSLEPHWFSSMYGVLFMAGQAVSGLALSILVGVSLGYGLPSLEDPASHDNEVRTARLHDLGNLLLAMVMFWSYVSFMQFLIIWSANLPEETPWYLRRSQGGWQWVVVSLAVLHFLIPILLLLMRQTKRNAPRIFRLAVVLLLMRLVDLSWLIFPTFTANISWERQVAATSHEHWGGPASIADLWPLLITFPAIGGCWIAFFSWRLSARLPFPVYEPDLIEEHRDELAKPAAAIS
jgi:hypothetical protein